jgi:hypothetical protein
MQDEKKAITIRIEELKPPTTSLFRQDLLVVAMHHSCIGALFLERSKTRVA